MSFRTSEWIAVAYFVYLAGAALAVPVPSDRRRRIVATAVLVVASVLSLARFGESGSALVVRDWMPLTYILLGYWLPALFLKAPNRTLEQALLALDHRWFGVHGLAIFAERAPRVLIELLELAYLFCYAMVPLGIACLYVAGLHDEIDRFWTAVLLAVFSCYGVLPWLPTRPPRATEHEQVRRPSLIRTLNLRVLGRASIQLNTFPSGHAAASLATALAVAARLPLAGLVLALVALGISLGSVLGRYHYAADVLSGAALALVGLVVSRFV